MKILWALLKGLLNALRLEIHKPLSVRVLYRWFVRKDTLIRGNHYEQNENLPKMQIKKNSS